MNKKINLFFLGIIAALGALVFEFILSIISPLLFNFDLSKIGVSFFLIIFIEEFFKLAVIWRASQEIDAKKEIFLNSALIGVGFSATEIFLNIFSHSSFLFSSYAGLLLIHTTTSLIFGYILSKKADLQIRTLVITIFFALLTHLLYNLSVLYDLSIFIPCAILITIIAFLTLKTFLPSKEN